MRRRAPRSTLFPYTTLFRSGEAGPAQGDARRHPDGGGEHPDGQRLQQHGAEHLAAGGAHTAQQRHLPLPLGDEDRKSTRLNSSHVRSSYAVFCLKKKTTTRARLCPAATRTRIDRSSALSSSMSRVGLGASLYRRTAIPAIPELTATRRSPPLSCR